MASKFKAIIFDLGGVLVEWDPHSGEFITASQLRILRNSKAWQDLDSGKLSLDEACKRFGKILGLDSSAVKTSLDQILRSVTVKKQLAELIPELKRIEPDLEFYIMSNICQEHFEVVRDADLPWSLFNSIFLSGALSMRKPDLCFFQHVIDAIGIEPSRIVMIDDKAANIDAARSTGIYGLLADEAQVEICTTLRNLMQYSSTLPRITKTEILV
ncbi:HAD-like domain-containing protein [Hypoxylon sp. FL1857]|nr:HAD-like domain-containing protein [Hypoxylon sp. FL1857]